VKVKLAPDQIVEDRRGDAELVDEQQLDRRDLLQPDAAIQGAERRVLEKQQEFDIGESVALAGGERAVHHSRVEPQVVAAQRPHALDHRCLRKHRRISPIGHVSPVKKRRTVGSRLTWNSLR